MRLRQLLLYQIEMLRDRIDDPRIIPSSDERAELLRLGAKIDHDIADIMKVVKPKTYRRWVNKKTDKPEMSNNTGRPQTAEEIVKLVIKLAKENIAWGYKRILGELRKLGIEIGLTTIRDILKRAKLKPSPQKSKTSPPVEWSDFIKANIESLIACDYFTKPIYTLFGKFDAYVLVFIHLGSRRIFMTPPTFNPDDDWLKIQIRSAAIWLDGIGITPKYLIPDGDKKFGKMFKAFWKSEGVRHLEIITCTYFDSIFSTQSRRGRRVSQSFAYLCCLCFFALNVQLICAGLLRCLKIPPRSPQANAFCECYIGTYKHQCLNSFFCLSIDQLDYINRKWVTYYNNHRPHQGKDIGNNILRPELCPASQWHPFGTSHSTRFPFASQAVSTPTSEGKIVRHESLGGVLAWYERAA